ncbi:MAG: hypothetical protein AB8G11_13415 [Saprospiraceae bacterium]
MKKKEFFEWIRLFNDSEKENLIKATKGLVPNQKTFFKDVINKIKKWQTNSIINFGDLTTKIEQKEGRNFTRGNFADAIRERLAPFLYRFIITNETTNDKLLKNQVLFKAVQKRHFTDTYYYHYLNEREVANKEQPQKSFDYYHEQSTIDYSRYFNAEFQKYTFKTTQNYTDFKAEEVLLNTWQNNKIAFLIKQYRLACEILCRQSIVKDNESVLNTIDFSYLNQQLTVNQLSESVALDIYSNIYQCFVTADFSDIEPIIPILHKTLDNYTIFTNEEQTSLLILLMNIVGRVKKINPTQTTIDLLEQIAIFGFENNIFGKESAIEENVYINLCDILKKNPLHKKLEKDWLILLPTEDDRIWVTTYLQIQKHIEKKEYYESLCLMQNLNHQNNIYFAFRKYIFQLMCMLELKLEIQKGEKQFHHKQEDIVSMDRFQDVLNNINYALSHTKYLQKPTKEEKEKFLNYVEAITLLYQENPDNDSIKQMLEGDTAMYAKAWLKQKFEIINV